MSEFKGTPGPWCLAETESSVSFDADGPRLTSWQDIGVFETGATVAIVLGFDEHPQDEGLVSEANARLIAAAPTLLAEVRRIAGDYCPDSDREAPMALAEMREALEAALSLACGEQADAG